MIEIELVNAESDGTIIVAIVRTSFGALKVMANVEFTDDCLILDRLHLHGIEMGANAVGAGRLRQIVQEVLDDLGVETIIIKGSYRTTGANPGHRPKPMRIARNRPS